MSDDRRLPYRDDPAGAPDPPDEGSGGSGPSGRPEPEVPASELDALVHALDRIADVEDRAYAAARAVERIVLSVRDPALYTLVAILGHKPPQVADRLDLPIATVVWAAARTGRPSSRS